MKQQSRLPVPVDLQNAAILCLKTTLSKANSRLKTNYIEPAIIFKNKGTIAGSAHLDQWLIQLNSHLLIKYTQHFINEVIPHELAHLLTFKYFGRVKPHGKEWQWMMNEILEQPAKRTHPFITENKAKKYHLYHCSCQTHKLSTIRHNKIKNNQLYYVCKKCHNKLLPHISAEDIFNN